MPVIAPSFGGQRLPSPLRGWLGGVGYYLSGCCSAGLEEQLEIEAAAAVFSHCFLSPVARSPPVLLQFPSPSSCNTGIELAARAAEAAEALAAPHPHSNLSHPPLQKRGRYRAPLKPLMLLRLLPPPLRRMTRL